MYMAFKKKRKINHKQHTFDELNNNGIQNTHSILTKF